jgi:cysteine desulfuration protein SufE
MDVGALIEDFQLFDNWEDRYTYLIDMGRGLPQFPEHAKVASNKVDGCLSQVWFIQNNAEEGRVSFDADSDSAIVRGLIGVIRVLFHGQSLERARLVDVPFVFAEIGLDEHLSVNRRNGFYAMIERVRTYIEE